MPAIGPLPQRERLITGTIGIDWPVREPFTLDLYGLLDRLVQEAKAEEVGGVPGTEITQRTRLVEETQIAEETVVKIVEKKRRRKP